MDFRYYFCRNGRIVFGDDIVAADLAEAIEAVKSLIASQNKVAANGIEIWSAKALVYSTVVRTGTRTVRLPPHVGQTTRLPPITSGRPAR